MPARASKETVYVVWPEGNDMFLGVWYQDEFSQDIPATMQSDRALFIDSVSARSLLHLSLHFLNAGLSRMEMVLRTQKKEEPPALPDTGDNGKVVKGTVWGQPSEPRKEPEEPEKEPEGNGDASGKP